jgi:hypothetical protein
MAKRQTRRNFLRTAPLAAAALPLAETLLSTAAEGQAAPNVAAKPAGPVQAYTAAQIEADLKALHAAPGNKDLIKIKGIGTSANLTVEGKKSGAEFEFHSFKDHVFYVLEGATTYLVGGTPKGAHAVGTGPGDWLAPECEGYQTVHMKKGDFLSVPRMTPHKRITESGVSLLQVNGIDPSRT